MIVLGKFLVVFFNKDLQLYVLVPFSKITNVLKYFSFESTYTRKWGWLFLCNTSTKAENITFLTLGSYNYDVHKKWLNFDPYPVEKLSNKHVTNAKTKTSSFKKESNGKITDLKG